MRSLLSPSLTVALSISILAAQTSPLAAQEATPPAASSAPAPNTLLDGTPVKLRLSQTISSADAKVGQEIPFEVIEEIKVDDVVVIPKSATAIANVTEADHKKSMGRAGKLNISITYVRLADNEKAAMRAVKESKGNGHVGAMTGAIVATSIVFFPAAPLFLFIHGKDVTIPQGTEITAFVQGDMHLDMSHFKTASDVPMTAIPAPAAPVQDHTTLSVDSTPAGADIEVDGAFVGSTPSSVTVVAGPHEIAVKKKGFAIWTRKLSTTSGTIHLSAELESSASSATPPPPTSNPPDTGAAPQ